MTESHPSATYKKGEEIELEISDLGESDECFGRLEDNLGVFVQGTVAVGDRVRASIFKVKKSFLKARVEEVVQPSPARIEPRCSHFGVCGGCEWQHVSYEEQLRLKRKRVADVLQHLGGFAAFEPEPVLPAPETFHYRNKVEFTFGRQRYLLNEERDTPAENLAKPESFALGFHAPRQYRKVLDVDECHIATPEMNEVLHAVKAFTRHHTYRPYSTHTHEGFWRNLVIRTAEEGPQLMVNIVTSWHEPELMAELGAALQEALGERLTTFLNNATTRRNTAAIGDSEHVILGPGTITERLGPFLFQISANSFFQTNTRQAVRLYEETIREAQLEGGETVYDLYCGTGSISLFLAQNCARVLGLEMNEFAVRDAEENARRNNVSNCTFKKLDLKDIGKVKKDLQQFGTPDVVVVDPPRAGVHPKGVETILNLAPKRVVYVSCNPASLARDAQALCENGAYTLDRVQPVDMFPHTNHIESVARLVRRD